MFSSFKTSCYSTIFLAKNCVSSTSAPEILVNEFDEYQNDRRRIQNRVVYHINNNNNTNNTNNNNSRKRKFLRYAISRFKNYNNGVYNKLYILIYLLLSVIISVSEQTNALILDSSASVHSPPPSSASGYNNNNGGATSVDNNGGSGSLDKFSLDSQIGAIFHRVAYATTTKRSIPDNDNVFVPSLTTVPTPSLTTFRYFEKESQINDQHQQQIKLHHSKYEFELERDHVLPTSAPNADILKSNNNPTYPNPNRHHNHNHRHQNATPTPQGHKKSPTFPMHPGNIPSYSPPTRSFFTPPLPREYSNPFADKPTLRGTNSEVGIMDTGNFMNRRPIPPPSLMPGHERVPIRPDLLDRPSSGSSLSISTLNTDLQQQQTQQQQLQQKKVVLNTPSHKVNKLGLDHSYDGSSSNRLGSLNSDNASDVSKIIPSISRILSGSNGRKEDIPDVLLRTVTVRPMPPIVQSTNEPPRETPPPLPVQPPVQESKNQDQDFMEQQEISQQNNNNNNNNDLIKDDEEDEMEDFEDFTSASQSNNANNGPNSNNNNNNNNMDAGETIYSTENIQNLPNVNHDRSLLTSTQMPQNPPHQNNQQNNQNNLNNKLNSGESEVATWTIAWNIHVYLSAILFTILAVYSIFKMMFYDKLTHLFNQSYFICIHLFLIIICLARIFYLCYDAYNIHLSFDPFISEILLNLPATFLTVGFATLILFLLIRSLNHKNNRYSPLMRPLTVLVACSVHVGLCITLHYVESIESKNFQANYHNLHQHHFQGQQHSNKYYNNIIRGHTGPPRLLSLICQIIYIFVCLSLGCFYLYIYRVLKRVLRNKSQNYIHGYQNLSYAIHITIAIALLFISMATLQIYGAISVSSTKSLTSYSIDINWPQWGYQFSLRLIEVTIIALLSWVTGLKTGASDIAINMDNGIIPPHGARSGLDFQLVNPNDGFTRTYETNSFRSIGGVGIHQNPTDTIKHHPHPQLHHHHPQQQIINHHPQINADSDRDYFSNDNNSQVMPDHYENPNFELRCDAGSSSDSNNHNNNDDYYSEPLNAHTGGHTHQSHTHVHHQQKQQPSQMDSYDSRSLNQPGGAPMAVPQQGYDFQNFERPTFDRSSSRNEFRVSKNLKALKNNTNTLNYNYDNTSNHSSAYGFTTGRNGIASDASGPFNQNSFERRSGVRKSGTLNNIGAIHHSRGGPVGNSSGPGLNGGCNSSSSSSSGIVVGRTTGIQTLNSRSTQQLQHHPNAGPGGPVPYDRDFQRNTSGRISNNKKLIAAAQQQQQQQQQPVPSQAFPTRGGIGVPAVNNNSNLDQYQSSSGDSATSGSMLVAEHGFVRFRELSDIGINEC